MGHPTEDELKKRLEAAGRQVSVGARYRHVNGGEYEVLSLVLLEWNDQPAVLYRSLEHPDYTSVRPLENWLERFNKI